MGTYFLESVACLRRQLESQRINNDSVSGDHPGCTRSRLTSTPYFRFFIPEQGFPFKTPWFIIFKVQLNQSSRKHRVAEAARYSMDSEQCEILQSLERM